MASSDDYSWNGYCNGCASPEWCLEHEKCHDWHVLPTDSQARKDTPIYSGVMKYFPLALAEVARLSKTGNDKHNPGQPLHWSRPKSNDHADCIARHLLEVGTIDPDDGHRHATKLAWRALALLQLELEAEAAKNVA